MAEGTHMAIELDDRVIDIIDRPLLSPGDLFRWARFLDQGQALSVSRERAVTALLEAAGADADALYDAYLISVRALGDGVATRSVVELLRDAKQYEALEDKGTSKERAARIA